MEYLRYGTGRKFFCYAELPWQKAFLRLLGVEDAKLLLHDPGKTYICRDVMTVEISDNNMTVNSRERLDFSRLAARYGRTNLYTPRLFISRLTRSRNNPHYRVLQNELGLAEMLAELGFRTIEPEQLPFEAQIAAFAGAEQIVCIGGSGLYNAAFCRPTAGVITIESSPYYLGHHTGFLASLGLRHGVIIGQEDMSDPSPWHRRWTLDITRARNEVLRFLRGL